MDIIATSEIAGVTGNIAYWTVRGHVGVSRLRDAWVNAGLSADLLPPAPTPISAMSRVMAHITNDKRITRPVPGTPGTHNVLIAETRNGRPHFASKYIVAAPADFNVDPPVVIDSETYLEPTEADKIGFAILTEVREWFNFFRLNYTASDQSGWMVTLAKRLGATTLRPSGGIYFVHACKLSEWEQWVNVLETACEGEVFTIPAMPTKGVVKAVIEAITMETAGFVADIDARIASGGMRALESRKREVAAFEKKITMYTDIIGEASTALVDKLDNLRTRLDAAQAQVFESL